MRITVENFGPIRKAKNIRIAPLTLFVGPSNTGKSYLAKAVSAAVESMSGVPSSGFMGEFSDFVFLTQKDRPETEKHSEMEKRFSEWAESMRGEWEKCFSDFFGEQGENIAKDMGMSVGISSDDGRTFVDLNKPQNEQIEKEELPGVVKMAELIIKSPNPQAKEKDVQIFTKGKIHESFVSSLCNQFSLKAYYLPTARGAVMQTYQVIDREALGSSVMVQSKKDKQTIPAVISGFVRQLDHIVKAGKGHGDKNIIDINDNFLESNIFNGRINVTSHKSGHPGFRYAQKGEEGDIAMNDVSAAIAELTPLSVFMRYCLRKGDLLVLEEPETGLHPQAQRDIADIMVRLANAGVFVLATTHSDIVLEQIGNAVRASQFNNVARGKKLLGENRQSLALENAAVYDFEKQPKHGDTIVNNVWFEPVTGVLTKDHMKVARELYDQTVDLVNGKSNEHE